MAPKVPKKVDAEIFKLLNESIDDGSLIPELQFERLVRKAKTLNVPYRYACLSALYSHTLNYDLAIENAVKSIQYSAGEQCCIENALSALSNMKLFKDIVRISKEYPILLNYSNSSYESYDAALHTLDLDYCEYIISKHSFSDNQKSFTHRSIMAFFENDRDVLSLASEYLNFVLEQLVIVLKRNLTRTSSIYFGIIEDANYSSLEMNVSFNCNHFVIDKVIDLEDEWHSLIAEFTLTNDKLCNIAFSMGVEDCDHT